MKKIILLVLLLSSALAGAALNRSDFSYEIVGGSVHKIDSNGKNITVGFYLDPRKGVDAFNITVRFDSPIGVEVANNTITLDIISRTKHRDFSWYIKSSESKEYGLSNLFEIISWDDSVSLTLDDLPTEANDRIYIISGKTDSAKLCEEHNFSGFWGKKENCNVQITIDNLEPFYADNEGYFSKEIELEEGLNTIRISARDPGGNTETKEITVNYIPSLMTIAKENIVFVLGGVFFIVFVIGAFVYWRSTTAKKLAEVAVVKAEKAKEEVITVVEEKSLSDLKFDQKGLVDKWWIAYQDHNEAKRLELESSLKPLMKRIVDSSKLLQELVKNEAERLKPLNLPDSELIRRLKAKDFIDVIKQEFPEIDDKSVSWPIRQMLTVFYNDLIRKEIYGRSKV